MYASLFFLSFIEIIVITTSDVNPTTTADQTLVLSPVCGEVGISGSGSGLGIGSFTKPTPFSFSITTVWPASVILK